MLRVGLTGGIASGKSTVANLFAELGASTIDTDVVAREMVAPGMPGLAMVVSTCGSHIISESGELDRQALRTIVFSDSEQRRKLEAILHPLIRAQALEQLKQQPIQQIWRDHLLAGIHRIANNFDEGFFVFLYPEQNVHCSEAIKTYTDFLTSAQTFASWTLEAVATAIKRHTDNEWIHLLIDRYLNFGKISLYAQRHSY